MQKQESLCDYLRKNVKRCNDVINSEVSPIEEVDGRNSILSHSSSSSSPYYTAQEDGYTSEGNKCLMVL